MEKQSKEKQIVKPPIGLTPKFTYGLERLYEVRSAIVRYYDAELQIPIEWIKEYNELIELTKIKDLQK